MEQIKNTELTDNTKQVEPIETEKKGHPEKRKKIRSRRLQSLKSRLRILRKF